MSSWSVIFEWCNRALISYCFSNSYIHSRLCFWTATPWFLCFVLFFLDIPNDNVQAVSIIMLPYLPVFFYSNCMQHNAHFLFNGLVVFCVLTGIIFMIINDHVSMLILSGVNWMYIIKLMPPFSLTNIFVPQLSVAHVVIYLCHFVLL